MSSGSENSAAGEIDATVFGTAGTEIIPDVESEIGAA